MGMFKPKKVKALPVETQEEEEEVEMEEEIEDEEEQEEVIQEVKKPVKKKSVYSKGDIIPIQQIIGYQVIEDFDKDGNPEVVSTDKLSEAKILSFIYRN